MKIYYYCLQEGRFRMSWVVKIAGSWETTQTQQSRGCCFPRGGGGRRLAKSRFYFNMNRAQRRQFRTGFFIIILRLFSCFQFVSVSHVSTTYICNMASPATTEEAKKGETVCSVAYIKRKPGLTPEQFYHHWEHIHGELVKPWFKKRGFISYTQVWKAH